MPSLDDEIAKLSRVSGQSPEPASSPIFGMEDVQSMISSVLEEQKPYYNRNALLISFAYRLPVPISELLLLQHKNIIQDEGLLYVNRDIPGYPEIFRLTTEELDWYTRSIQDFNSSIFIFSTEEGIPVSIDRYNYIISKASSDAGYLLTITKEMVTTSQNNS